MSLQVAEVSNPKDNLHGSTFPLRRPRPGWPEQLPREDHGRRFHRHVHPADYATRLWRTLESMNYVDPDIAFGLGVWKLVAEQPPDVIKRGFLF